MKIRGVVWLAVAAAGLVPAHGFVGQRLQRVVRHRVAQVVEPASPPAQAEELRYRPRPGAGLVREGAAATPRRSAVVASAAEAEAAADAAGPRSLSMVERARTVAQSCTSATLCTIAAEGSADPFGSHVDYVLDACGTPVLLLSDQSLHTKNLEANPTATLFAMMPSDSREGQVQAAMSRVSIVGEIAKVVDKDEVLGYKTQYSVTHTYSTRLLESDNFAFYKLVPSKIYYVGGFGVMSDWVDVVKFETAKPDLLALESNRVVLQMNKEKQKELRLLCEQFIPNLAAIESVDLTEIDRLGIDMRVTTKESTQQYRVGFISPVQSMEDAKSEMLKIFQEAWEKSEGFEWEDMGPPIKNVASDILRK